MEFKDIVGITMRGLQAAPTHRFGTIFGYTEQRGADGSGTYECFRAIFHDFASNRPEQEVSLDYQHVICGLPGLGEPPGVFSGIGSKDFLPSRQIGGAGKWRTIRFDVSPGSVAAFWVFDDGQEENYAEYPTAELNRIIRTDAERYRKKVTTPIEFPEWAADRPIGIACESATVEVRKVRIVPK